MKSKKAVELTMNTIVSLVLFITVMALLMNFYSDYKETSERMSQISTCKTSVIAESKAGAKGLIGTLSQGMEIKCPTQDILIEETAGKNDKTDNNIMREIGDEMYDCGNMFLIDKTKDKDFVLFESIGSEGVFCSVCSIIEFEEKNKQLKGLPYFLETNAIPGSKQSYMDYLRGDETKEARSVMEALKPHEQALIDENLDTSKKYGTIFVYAKGTDMVTSVSNKLSYRSGSSFTLASGTVGAFGGLSLIILGSNPIGWVALGVGASVVAIIELSTDEPEQASFVVFEEYSESSLKDLGCQYFPSSQMSTFS